MSGQFAVLVNTSDGYEDCWDPFFSLFKRYWPDHSGPIYLNTEHSDYRHSALDVVPLKSAVGAGDTDWSSCLQRALCSIPSEFVLYLQEDYFLRSQVNGELVRKLAEVLSSSSEIDCIHLTHYGARHGIERSSARSTVERVSRFGTYRMSLQAALWRKSALSNVLVSGESAWMCELLGTVRCWRRNRPQVYKIASGLDSPLDYVTTGVMKGKWNAEVVPLFEDNGIRCNFERRGFFPTARPPFARLRTASLLLMSPRMFIRGLW